MMLLSQFETLYYYLMARYAAAIAAIYVVIVSSKRRIQYDVAGDVSASAVPPSVVWIPNNNNTKENSHGSKRTKTTALSSGANNKNKRKHWGRDVVEALESLSKRLTSQLLSEHANFAIQISLHENMDRLNSLSDQQRKYREYKFRASTEAEKDFYQTELDTLAEEVEVCQMERRRLKRQTYNS